jgi:hypothetical protein
MSKECFLPNSKKLLIINYKISQNIGKIRKISLALQAKAIPVKQLSQVEKEVFQI